MAKKDDLRAFFKLDVGYLSNPKIALLLDDSPGAVLLHLECIAYSAQHLTDGVVPVRLAMRIACAEQSDLSACLDAGLLRRVNDTHVEVHDYLLHQRSAESVKGASEQAKQAAQARWDKAAEDAERIAGSKPEREEREERSKTPCASADAERDAAPSSPALSAKRAAAQQVDADFAEWYALYPRKKAKGQAVKAYRAARKKPGVTRELLLDALRQQLAELEGRVPEKRPYPGTWLNHDSWEDERDDETPSSDGGSGWQRPAPLPSVPPEFVDDPAGYQRWLADWNTGKPVIDADGNTVRKEVAP